MKLQTGLEFCYYSKTVQLNEIFWNHSLDGPNVSYQNTNHELSFGNENFGDDVVTHQALEMNKPYTIRMNQVKETNGQYLYTIEVDGETIFEVVNLKPYFSSSTSVYFSNDSNTSLGNDAIVTDLEIFNGRNNGLYHGIYWKTFFVDFIYSTEEKLWIW